MNPLFPHYFFQQQHAACGERATIPSMISCIHVSKSFAGKQVLSDVTLAVQPSEWVTIVGASRSGKSTLLRLLLRAEMPDHGSIDIDGVPLASLPPSVLQLYRARLGVILQDPLLLATDSVLENILLPFDLHDGPRDRAERSALTLLKRLGLSGRERAGISTLSASEKMLASIARAVIRNPMILLADDPTGPLDAQQTEAVIALFREAHAAGMSVVFFTADAALAKTLPGRMVQLDQGRIVETTRQSQPVETPMPQASPVVATPAPAPAPAVPHAPAPQPAPVVQKPEPTPAPMPAPSPSISPAIAAAFPSLRTLTAAAEASTPAQNTAARPANPHARKPPVRGVPRMSKHGMGPGTHVPKQPDAMPAMNANTQQKNDDSDGGGHRIKITSINS
jgi:cell division transport system ATP-binding protein